MANRLAIAVGRETSAIEAFAARQLREYLTKITGRPVNITAKALVPARRGLILGTPGSNAAVKTSLAQLDIKRLDGNEDGFVIKTMGNHLYLAGNSARAVLYAVYTFLERCMGVRWFYPDRQDEVIPKRRKLDLGRIDIAQKPIFEYRVYHLLLTEKEDSRLDLEAMVDWIAKLKMSHVFLHPPYNFGLWERFSRRHSYLFTQIRKRGLKLIVGTHGWDNFLTGDHHSEYQQPCYHRRDVLELLADRVLTFLKRHPEIDIFGFWPIECHRMCQCPKCRREKQADLLMRAVNFVARRTKRALPRVQLTHLAYNARLDNHFLSPPQKVSPDGNVMVEFCAWGRDYSEPFALPKYRVWSDLAKRWRRLRNSKGRRPTLIMHEKYGRYGAGFGYHPLPLKVVPRDFAYLETMDVDGIEMQVELANWWACGFGRYATAKWMWDHHIPRQAMIKDYCERYYGAAAKDMRRHFEAVERATPGLAYYPRNVHSRWYDAASHFSLSEIEPCLTYLKRAQDVLKGAGKHLSLARRATKDRVILRRIRSAQFAYEHVARQICSGVIQHEAHAAILDCSAFDRCVAARHLRSMKKALDMELENIKIYHAGKEMYFWESRENATPWRDPRPGGNMFLNLANAAIASCKNIAGRLDNLMGKPNQIFHYDVFPLT